MRRETPGGEREKLLLQSLEEETLGEPEATSLAENLPQHSKLYTPLITKTLFLKNKLEKVLGAV